ncbi:MAG: hypothetical protein RBR23_11345 [Arcobacteraceae bacterium]|jgi:hypothetical protein|nr:hypothetical protein [Arcobacteraceae bacterium]
MLLVQLTVGGVVRYLSDDYHAVEHFYEAAVVSLGQLRIATRQPWGGWAEPEYGDLVLLPSVFSAAWPPPRTCAVSVWLGQAGETGARLLFTGTAYLAEIGREAVVYALYGPEYATEVEDATYTGTLASVFAAACATLGLTLNATYGRTTSPAVLYAATGKERLIDRLSDLAAFFSHRFYIEGTTLYLVDCLRDNGAILGLTEFDVLPGAYTASPPCKRFVADYPLPPPRNIQLVFDESTGAGTAVYLAEVKLNRNGNMDAWLSPTTLSASSSHASYPIANARDNNAATFWSSGGGVPGAFVQAVYGTSPLFGYSLQAHPSVVADNAPTSWAVYGLCANRSEYKLMGQGTAANWAAGEIKEFELPKEVNAPIELAGSHPFGDEVPVAPACHTTYAQILAALGNIKTIMERTRVQLRLPLDVATLPRIGQKLTLTDESLAATTSVWARVSAITYDFDTWTCVVEGEGGLT